MLEWDRPRGVSKSFARQGTFTVRTVTPKTPILNQAAKLLEPKAQHVALPGETIKNDDELKKL
jgi:hypothetical protein